MFRSPEDTSRASSRQSLAPGLGLLTLTAQAGAPPLWAFLCMWSPRMVLPAWCLQDSDTSSVAARGSKAGSPRERDTRRRLRPLLTSPRGKRQPSLLLQSVSISAHSWPLFTGRRIRLHFSWHIQDLAGMFDNHTETRDTV